MKSEENKFLDIKSGILAGLPIVIGYFPIAMTFGILSKTTGISFIESALFSILVYAGTSQFMALNLLNVGAGIGEIMLTTFLINFRHFLMSASIATNIKKDSNKLTPFIAFGVTDELFSVALFKEGEFTDKFIMSLHIVSYLSWTIGTMCGYLIGEVLPFSIKNSMEIGIYAMFIAILIPEVKKSNRVLIMALLSGFIHTLLNYYKILPQGWNLIFAIVFVSLLGTFAFREEEVRNYENYEQ